MAYNYSLNFLRRHDELVQKLRTAAQTGETLESRDKDYDAVVRVQLTVNNLLASLALNYPAEGDIRKVLRTWLHKDPMTDEWVLSIGNPKSRLVGRPPQGYVGQTPTVQTRNPELYIHPDEINDMAAMTTFISRIASAPSGTRVFQAPVPGGTPETVIPYFESTLEAAGIPCEVTFNDDTVTIRKK